MPVVCGCWVQLQSVQVLLLLKQWRQQLWIPAFLLLLLKLISLQLSLLQRTIQMMMYCCLGKTGSNCMGIQMI